MDTDSFILHIKTDDFYRDIKDDVKNKFDTSNYTEHRSLPIRMNKTVVGLMKVELGGKIIRFIELKPKTYSYLTDYQWNVCVDKYNT